jgi:hypothetical protein
MKSAPTHAGLSLTLSRKIVIDYPAFPDCECEMHCPDDPEAPAAALDDPFLFLPAPIEFTAEMDVIADRYKSHDIDWQYYPAFQAAAFLQPKSAQQHSDRRQRFQSLKASVESEGFIIPDELTRLLTTDAIIDRLHHNCVWPTLPDEVVRLPSDSRFAVFLFLIEGQACGIWHLLLSPDGSHRVVTADNSFGCPSSYPPARAPDPATFRVYRCMDSINRLLYHYFRESAQHDVQYVVRLQQYFAEQGAA